MYHGDDKSPDQSTNAPSPRPGQSGMAGLGPGKRTLVEQVAVSPGSSSGTAGGAQSVRVKNHRVIPADQDAERVRVLDNRCQVRWEGKLYWVDMKDVEARQAPAPAQAQASAATEASAPDPFDTSPRPPAIDTSPQPVAAAIAQQSTPQATTSAASSTDTGAASSAPVAGAAAAFDGLGEVVQRIYAERSGKPTADDFITALQAFFGDRAEEIINNSRFAWELMRLVGENSGKRLHDQIVQARGRALLYNRAAVYSMPWTLRHYTRSANEGASPSYRQLKSTLELNVRNITKSENTNDADWAQIGNVGFSFYLLCVNGVVPSRAFLSNCTHYAEFDFDRIPSMFVSGDMLGATKGEQKQPGLKGDGAQVKQALCSLSIDRAGPESFLKALDEHFGNFEVKVPGQLDVAEWKQK